jgi:phosphopantetheinyl transferase
MPVFFQHQINEATRLGIWKIEETEEFFKANVPQHREVTHPHKRLQHLAGRFLLQFLFPDFPYHLIQLADTRKPFLPNEEYHFSISHCGDFAAAIVSRDKRVGIDIEIPVPKIEKIRNKFLSDEEYQLFHQPKLPMLTLAVSMPTFIVGTPDAELLTLLWSAKEATYKWHGSGGIDFRKHIQLRSVNADSIAGWFGITDQQFLIHYRRFDHLYLTWISHD